MNGHLEVQQCTVDFTIILVIHIVLIHNVLIHKLLNFTHQWHFKKLPNIFSQHFCYASEVHTYNTRYASKSNFYKPRFRTNIGKQTTSAMATEMWQQLPTHVKNKIKKVCAVCFDPPKRVNLQQAYQQKSPVKISGIKRSSSTSFSNNQDQYKILKQAKILPTSTHFEYNAKIGSSLVTVEQALSADLYKNIDVHAKVMSKQQNKQPILRNGKKIFKVDCIIADQTHSIKLVLWEELINQVDCGKSYLFRGVTTRVFDDVKYLSTNEATIIENKDDITNVNLTFDEIKDTIVEGKCIGVHIKKQQTCVICNHTLDTETDKELVTCPHCNITMLSSTCTTKVECSM